MKTKVICAFPGTGKSYYVSNNRQGDKVVDLDTNEFTLGYTDDGYVRDSGFPDNYLLAIRKYLGVAHVLFVGCQPEVICALREAGISFTLVYPKRELKDEYIRRFQQRHSSQSFVNLLSKNWDVYFDFLKQQDNCERIVLDRGKYISDVIDFA